MPKPYSLDLRERTMEAVLAGASRREVEEQYELSPSVVIIWMRRRAMRKTGTTFNPSQDAQ
jgi:transposase